MGSAINIDNTRESDIMRKGAFIFIIVIPIIFSYTALAIAQPYPVRIMPLGDSITRGDISGLAWELTVGYRQKLYLDLINAAYNIDFVGSLNNGSLADPPFDYNHEGHGGWKDSEVAGEVLSWLVFNPAVCYFT